MRQGGLDVAAPVVTVGADIMVRDEAARVEDDFTDTGGCGGAADHSPHGFGEATVEGEG